MGCRSFIGAAALAVALLAPPGVQAFDESKYPDLKGHWRRTNTGNPLRIGLGWDQSKPVGLGQEAPLTPEYQAIYEANLKDQAEGGQGSDPTFTCLSPGMPRVMIAYAPMEVVVTPEITYILMEHIHDNRRIHTDGRPFPTNMDDDPQFSGYSIGKWLDEDGDGRYDVLEVETRHLRAPHTYDAQGIPFHQNNQAVIRERIYLDKADRNLLHDDITSYDHALTQPWTKNRTYKRVADPKPVWLEQACAADNAMVKIGDDAYFLSSDGFLMPVRKNQPPPDTRYFAKKK